MMGGNIQVHSELGQGSEFIVEVPLVPAPAAPAQADRVPAWAGRSVLLLETSATQCAAMARRLSRLGLRVRAARTAEALALEGMDAVLLDERLARAGQDLAGLPVVLVRSCMNPAADAPGDYAAVLHKPVRRGALLAALGRALAAAAPAAGEVMPPAPPPGGAAASGLRVLLAEDNEINQMVAQHMLGQLGCEVALVTDGEQAITAIGEAAGKGAPFELVLMDVQMPVLDGLEAVRRLRQQETAGSRLPRIVAVTAHAMEGDRERCLAAGMDDYITKPITLASLAAALARGTSAAAGLAGMKPALT